MASNLSEMAVRSVGRYADALDAPSSPGKATARRMRRRMAKVLTVGGYLYDQVRQIESEWIAGVVSGRLEYDLRDEETILAMHLQWLEPVPVVARRIQGLEAAGVVLPRSKVFRRQAERMAWIMGRWPAHRRVRPVGLDARGNLYELDGRRFVMPGLGPEDVLQALAEARAGQLTPLRDVIRERGANAPRSAPDAGRAEEPGRP